MLHGFEFALKVMKKRPLRTSLTLVQVALGVAAITVVLSFVYSLLGISQGIHDNGQMFQVEYGKEVTSTEGVSRKSTSIFTPEMVEYFRQESSYFRGFSIVEQSYGRLLESEGIRYGTKIVMGVDAGFHELTEIKIISGDFFSSADVQKRVPVLVISDAAAEQLFGKGEAVGRTVRTAFQGEPEREFSIIGVFSGEKQIAGGEVAHFLVPYSLAIDQAETVYSQLWALCTEGKLTEGKEELAVLFKHYLQDKDNYQVIPGDGEFELIFQEIVNYQQVGLRQIVKTLGLFIGSFAFVALVISFIGILSMMLVSIVERTREIGLRRALGASRLSIVWQIILESVMISFCGGIFGVIIAGCTVKPIVNGLIIKSFFQGMSGLRASLSLWPILISMSSVVFVGLMAGLYPGIQAAKLLPVQAIKEG